MYWCHGNLTLIFIYLNDLRVHLVRFAQHTTSDLIMDASTRLYSRLGEIPEDPNDPDNLAELLVCAFGAFERYYVCWKTKAGEYKQVE